MASKTVILVMILALVIAATSGLIFMAPDQPEMFKPADGIQKDNCNVERLSGSLDVYHLTCQIGDKKIECIRSDGLYCWEPKP